MMGHSLNLEQAVKQLLILLRSFLNLTSIHYIPKQ